MDNATSQGPSIMETFEIHEDIMAIVELGYILKQMSIEGTDLGRDAKAFPCAAAFGQGRYTKIMGRAIEALALNAEERLLGLQDKLKEVTAALETA